MLSKWIDSFKSAHIQTKIFVFTLLLHGIITVATAVYSYARLDFTRALSEKTISKNP